MNRTQLLDDALTSLRTVFGKYRGTPHWSDGGDSSITVKNCVWNLGDADYHDFCWHSVCGGSAPQQLLALRYFLPRVARDLSFRGNAPWCEPQLASLLNSHAWQEWPDSEVSAIKDWFAAWIRHTVIEGSWLRSSEATKCAAICGCDLDDFFHDFLEGHREMSLQWLARQIEANWASLLKTGWPDGWQEYWSQTPPENLAVRFIVRILRRSSVGMLQGAFFADPSDEAQSLFSRAIQHAEDCLRFGHLQPGSPLGRAIACPQMAT